MKCANEGIPSFERKEEILESTILSNRQKLRHPAQVQVFSFIML